MRLKEESLYRALRVADMQLRGLPKQYRDDDGRFWIKAIVLVQKLNLEECYCLYSRHGDGYMRLVMDCGSGTGVISKVLSIHPYVYLDMERFFPNMPYPQKRSFLRTELSECTGVFSLDVVDSLSDEEVDVALLNVGIRLQLENRDSDVTSNLQIEGSDLDGTWKVERMEGVFRAELAQMRIDGMSQAKMDAFSAKHSEEMRNVLSPPSSDHDGSLSEEEEIHAEMEERDRRLRSRGEPVESVEGEFDPEHLDLEAIRAAAAEYRHEQRLISKRKYKRKESGADKILTGRSFINELSEVEEIETIGLPEDASKKQLAILERAEAKKAREDRRQSPDKPRRKPGRPRGSKNRKTLIREGLLPPDAL